MFTKVKDGDIFEVAQDGVVVAKFYSETLADAYIAMAEIHGVDNSR